MDVDDETVTVEFEIDEQDLEQVVIVAVEEGAVIAADDFKVGSESQKKLLNPDFHVPLKKDVHELTEKRVEIAGQIIAFDVVS